MQEGGITRLQRTSSSASDGSVKTSFESILGLLVLASVGIASCSSDEGGSSAANGKGGASGAGGKGGATGGGGATSTGGDGGKGGQGGKGHAGTAGSGGEAGDGGPECDATATPDSAPCLVSDDYAIFVAPAGNDDDAGTMAEPLATLTKAVEVAAGTKIVIVCNGEFDEEVLIGAGARVYGGFDCSDWQRAADVAPLFQPSGAGPALKIDGVEDPVVIEGVDFAVGDALGDGATALAAVVNESAAVTLRGVTLTAGAGTAGLFGTNPGFQFAGINLSGIDGTQAMGGSNAACACPGGATTTRGGGGAPEQAGSDGLPDYDGPGGEAGLAGVVCSPDGVGRDGAPGPSGGDAAGATTYGTLSNLLWTPATGGDAENGQPGQGGGGGAGRPAGGGGSGGCGGCGGKGGTGGGGGGASIGILSVASSLTLEASVIQTASAGNGGSGAPGQQGMQSGGVAGDGFGLDANVGCHGGVGGIGGKGGGGGGGAGGISVGVVHVGAAPTVSDTMITVGSAGLPGEGGAGTNDGIEGVAQEILSLD